jgi:alpha-L-fucosidase
MSDCPKHLFRYAERYVADPRGAALAWFQDAVFGLFVHYALPSLLPAGTNDYQELMQGRDELNKLCLCTPEEIAATNVAEADRRLCLTVKTGLRDRFVADRFDAEAIGDLALAAGMQYVTFVTRHAGGLFLHRTSVTGFHSVNSPAGRDLVAEVAHACEERGLGCFLYVPPDTARTDGTFRERNATVLRELLTSYGPIAGIWFDGIALFDRCPDNYKDLPGQYGLIRSLQPQVLVSFKEGAIGTEDFITSEHFLFPGEVRWAEPGRRACWERRLEHWKRVREPSWHLFRDKPAEINTTMQEATWRDGRGQDEGWTNNEKARHLSADEVWELLEVARSQHANLLMNVGPRADGSIHPDDEAALRAVGDRIREHGFPEQ